jgi:hypothetical protein
MRWEDYHLHQFEIGRHIYGVPDADPDGSMNKIDLQMLAEKRAGRSCSPSIPCRQHLN